VGHMPTSLPAATAATGLRVAHPARPEGFMHDPEGFMHDPEGFMHDPEGYVHDPRVT